LAEIKHTYNINDLISECALDKPAVTVSDEAVQDARNYFNLPTAKAVVAFIGNGGLGNKWKFDKSTPLRKNIRGSKGVMVDSYTFVSGSKNGYIAFLQKKNCSGWHVKSFKKNDKVINRSSRRTLGGAI
jgi:hypothetical protein